jgi:hypothetical protein
MSSFELLDQKRCVVVFPDCIRSFFLYDRSLLGGLARCAFRTVQHPPKNASHPRPHHSTTPMQFPILGPIPAKNTDTRMQYLSAARWEVA